MHSKFFKMFLKKLAFFGILLFICQLMTSCICCNNFMYVWNLEKYKGNWLKVVQGDLSNFSGYKRTLEEMKVDKSVANFVDLNGLPTHIYVIDIDEFLFCYMDDNMIYHFKDGTVIDRSRVSTDSRQLLVNNGRTEKEYIGSSVTKDKCILGNCYDGYGTYIRADGDNYAGEWKDGKRHGQGTYTWANGDKYKGDWKDGKVNGWGTYTYANGDNHVGGWKDGKVNGRGTYTWANGDILRAEWQQGYPNGQAILRKQNGDSYDGQIRGWIRVDGKWDFHKYGKGTYTWADGGKYVGEWKDDKEHGRGTATLPDGSVVSLIMADGEIVEKSPWVTEPPPKKELIKSIGSGFLMTKSGLVITNYHVVEGATSCEVLFPAKGITKNASIKIKDVQNDIVILEINNFRFSDISSTGIPFSIANISTVKIGQEVFTLGFPLGGVLGASAKLSKGNINSLYGLFDDPRLLQISNPIQPGNSGGALFNRNGELVGIVVASLDAVYLYEKAGFIPQNLNFAIKVNYLRNLIGMLPEARKILKRPSSLVGMSLERQIEEITPFVVTINVK